MINNNYNTLSTNGFDIEIKANSEGFARMYLVFNGKRTGHYKYFRDNRMSTLELQDKIKTAKKNSHMDNAMKSIVDNVKEILNNVLEVNLKKNDSKPKLVKI